MAALKILFVSFCCLPIGAVGVCAVYNGPGSALFSAPVFAIVGWVYLFPIYCAVAAMWLLDPRRLARIPWSLPFVLLGSASGGCVMVLLGAKSADLHIHDGIVLGGTLAGRLSNWMIVLLKWGSPNHPLHATPARLDVSHDL